MFHLFIINPFAGQYDSSKELMSEIKQCFQHLDYAIEITKYPHHATELVSEYQKKHTKLTVYACGGDGSVNEVINGIKENLNIHLAIVPIGTGNDFIRSYSEKPIKIKDYLNASSSKIDLIKIEHKYGLNVISAGFDAAVAKNMHRFRKFGKQAYYMSIAYTVLKSLNHELEFIINDQIHIPKNKFLMGICANGKYYGGGMLVSPYSKIDDRYLDFISIKAISRFQIPKFMQLFIKGKHIDDLKKYVDTLKCRKVQFIAKNAIDINIDGEIHSMINPTIELLSESLNLLIPNNS